MRTKPARALVLSAHTDDAEIGCGGYVARLLEEGTQVHALIFSAAEASVPGNLPPDIARRESARAAELFGVPSARWTVRSLPVRHFPEHRQDILETLFRYRGELQPDLVLAPSLRDLHQDHRVVAEEARRAFKGSTVLGYEIPWNTPSFGAQAFAVLDQRHLEIKRRALALYQSQQHRGNMDGTLAEAQARLRGAQCGVALAEAFEVESYVISIPSEDER